MPDDRRCQRATVEQQIELLLCALRWMHDKDLTPPEELHPDSGSTQNAHKSGSKSLDQSARNNLPYWTLTYSLIHSVFLRRKILSNS
jgi:hypothetical protein